MTPHSGRIARRLLFAAAAVAPRAPQRIDLGHGLAAEVHVGPRRGRPLRERPDHLALVGRRAGPPSGGGPAPTPEIATTTRKAA